MPAIKVTGFVPKGVIDIDEVRLELLNALRKEGRLVRRELQKATRTWNHKVTFDMKVSLAKGDRYVQVSTDDQIFAWVNDGTRSHMMGPILPVNKKALKIPSGSILKTTPHKLSSRKGRQVGPYFIRKRTRRFLHPGTEGRFFTQVVVDRIERTNRFQKGLDVAVQKGIAKSIKKGKVVV